MESDCRRLSAAHGTGRSRNRPAAQSYGYPVGRRDRPSGARRVGKNLRDATLEGDRA